MIFPWLFVVASPIPSTVRKETMMRGIARRIIGVSALMMIHPVFAMTQTRAQNLFLASAQSTVALAKLKAAAESGDATAEDWLGLAYQSGLSKGLHQSYTLAAKWFEKAAAQGCANADFNLGSMYRVGAGVPQDFSKAKLWYAKAAALGSVEGRYSLDLLKTWAPVLAPMLRRRARVAKALFTGPGGFRNRYDAQLWLTDMSDHLQQRIPNPVKRLNLLKRIYVDARHASLSPELVLSVISVESDFDRFAVSHTGARGLMQVMPFWPKALGQPKADLFDVDTNLRIGCAILRYYLDKTGGNLTQALARYNGSIHSNAYPARVYAMLRKRWRSY